MPLVNETEARILSVMSGAERVRMLLRQAGFKTLTDFAYTIPTHSQTVSYCINGDREYSEIRNAIASALGLSRAEIDALIDGTDVGSAA